MGDGDLRLFFLSVFYQISSLTASDWPRFFKIGFNRAARIMDQLCEAGVVGEEEGTKPRKILMTMEQFENMMNE